MFEETSRRSASAVAAVQPLPMGPHRDPALSEPGDTAEPRRRSSGLRGSRVGNRTRRRGWALGVIGSAQFVLLLDLTIVNVALPTVQDELGLQAGALQWLVTAYALTFGGFLLLAGRAADVFGRLRLFVAGILLFGVASLAAGLAVDPWTLVAARAAQGLGGAAVSPAALALLTTTFEEGKERNRALGIFAVIGSAGGASGLLLGGVLTQWAGWRWIFLVNVPVAVAAALLGPVLLRDSRDKVSRHLDVAGAVTSTSALLALVFGLTRAGESGFDDEIALATLALAVGFGSAFVMAERRTLDPLVPFRLLRLRGLLGNDLTSLAASTVIAATPFLLTLYMQRALGLTPLMTGLAFLPMTLTIMVTTMLVTRSAERIGIRRLLLLGVGALFVAALVLSRIPPDGRYPTDVLPGMLLFAVGLAATYTASAIGGTTAVPDVDQGVAGGLLNASKQVGGAVGLAVLAVVASGGGGDVVVQSDKALVAGLSNAFIAAIGFAALAVVLAAWLVPERGGERGSAPSTRDERARCRRRDSGISPLPLTDRRRLSADAPAAHPLPEAC